MIDELKQVESALRSWLYAISHEPIEQVLSYVTEDVTFLRQESPPLHGKRAFAASLSSLRGLYVSVVGVVREVVVSGDLAYCCTDLTVTAVPTHAGDPMRSSGTSITVLRKESGVWRIARDANTLAQIPGLSRYGARQGVAADDSVLDGPAAQRRR